MQGLDPVVDHEASETDRRGFKQHSQRTHRLRGALRGELGGKGDVPPVGYARRVIVVRQVQPGLRMRRVFWLADDCPAPETCPEEFCAALFDALGDLRGPGVVSFADVYQRAQREPRQ